MRIPKVGRRVHVDWIDIIGLVNDGLSKATPAPCWSEGLLVRVEEDYIVLASSMYGELGDDPIGAYTVIVIGCIKQIRIL